MFPRHLAIVTSIAVLVFASCTAKTARGDLSEKVQNFDQYPLVWLGPSYDADGDGSPDPITAVRLNVSPAFYHPRTGVLLKPEIRTFSISYGTCEIPDGATACPIPLQLDFSAACDSYPLSDVAKVGVVPVRGIEGIVQIGGALRLETADFTVTVSPIGDSDEGVTKKAIVVANDLIPANAKARSSVNGRNFRTKPANLCAAAAPTVAPGTLGSATATATPSGLSTMTATPGQ